MTLALDQRHGLTLLTRLAQRRPEETHLLRRALAPRLDALLPAALAVAMDTGDPIGKVLADLVEAAPDTARAERIYGLVPHDTIVLREVVVVATTQLVAARLRTVA